MSAGNGAGRGRRDGRRREGMTVREMLTLSGCGFFGVLIANLLTRGFSWGDLAALVAMWAFAFLLLAAFQGYLRPARWR